MKNLCFLMIVGLSFLVSCNLFKSENERRKVVITEALYSMENADTAHFLELMAEKNLAKDKDMLLTHFGMAGQLMNKYGRPSEESIVFRPLEHGAGELGTRATVKLKPPIGTDGKANLPELEFIFLNDNPEAEKFIDFRLAVSGE